MVSFLMHLVYNTRVLTLTRLFIIEALITVVVSIVCYWFIVPFPENATFLTPAERTLLETRLEADGGGVRHDNISFRRVIPMIADWKIWIW